MGKTVYEHGPYAVLDESIKTTLFTIELRRNTVPGFCYCTCPKSIYFIGVMTSTTNSRHASGESVPYIETDSVM